MNSLRALAIAALAALQFSDAGAAGVSTSLVRSFAACEGRLIAEVRHSFIADAEAASRADAQRETFAMLVDAVRADAEAEGMGRYRALGWRITADVAQDGLRRRARGLPDMSARRYQHALAETHLAACRQMITGG